MLTVKRLVVGKERAPWICDWGCGFGLGGCEEENSECVRSGVGGKGDVVMYLLWMGGWRFLMDLSLDAWVEYRGCL